MFLIVTDVQNTYRNQTKKEGMHEVLTASWDIFLLV